MTTAEQQQLDRQITVMTAARAGKEIEFRRRSEVEWEICEYPQWDWANYDYRVAVRPRRWVICRLGKQLYATLYEQYDWDSRNASFICIATEDLNATPEQLTAARLNATA